MVLEGNSGGPVIYVGLKQNLDGSLIKEFSLIGLVTDFLPRISISKNEKNVVTRQDLENSAYSLVEPIDNVIELIESAEK